MLPMQGMQALHPPAQPATTLPLPQMANRPPLATAAPIEPSLLSLPSLSAQPMTLPGQGPPPGQSGHPARHPFLYPTASERSNQSAPISTRNPVVVASGQPGRDATSTALVQPMSYPNGQPMMVAPPPAYSPMPQLSRRTKIVLGGAGLVLFAAIATIAIIKGARSDAAPDKVLDAPPTKPVVPPKPVVEPIRDPKAVKSNAPPKTDKDRAVSPIGTMPILPKPDKASMATPPAATPPAASPPATPPIPTSPTPVTPKTDKIAATPPTDPAPPIPVTNQTDKVAAAASSPKIDPSRNDKRAPRRTDKRPDKPDRSDKPDRDKPDRSDKKPTPVKPEVVASPPRNDKVEIAASSPKADKKHGGRTTQDVKISADALYRAKRFSDAAALVTAALPSFSGSDSQELKTIAAIYAQLGKDYNVGMAPGTKAADAYTALRRARNFDHDVGSAYVAEIEHVLVNVAARAALSYAAAKEYELAFQAIRQAEALGSTSPTNKSVRDKLEEIAAELYRSATSELATDLDGARKKLHQIQGMVDQKNPLYGKATKLLNGA
jgi:hypothetical protein